MYKVTQVATGVAGAPYYLTGYFDTTTGTAQQAADRWRALLSAGVSTYAAPLVLNAITEVPTIDPTNGNLTGLSTVAVAAVTMTGAGEPLPAATSLLLRWRTGVYIGGREIRGRTNIPRMTEPDSTAGVPNAALISAWQTRQNTLLGSPSPSHVIWSPKNHLWAYTTAGSPWSQWAVLRSRRD